MSYINEALRKAQKERDHRYGQFQGILSPCSDGSRSGRHGSRRLAIGVVSTLLVLIPAGVLLAVYVLQQSPQEKKGDRAPVAMEVSAMPGSTVLPAAKEAPPDSVQTHATPPGAQAEKEVIPRKGTQAAVQAAEKPVHSGKAFSIGEEPFPREAEARYKEALSAQRSGDTKKAEALYRRVLLIDPGHVRALNNLGVLYMKSKNTEQAMALFGKAIVLKKDYVDPYYNLACLYARKNEINESLWYMKIASAIDGDVIDWVKKDADMKNVVASPEFKKITKEQKN
jgi:tetratricopeptide (TPR) repeat protein